ncbi:MAG: hypothetical protein AB1445_04340 [Bacillota bacterium]
MRDKARLTAIIVAAVVVVFLVPVILAYLWNTTMPEVFGVARITYWQMVRLFLLVTSFTGGVSVAVNTTGRTRSEYEFRRKGPRH